MVPGSSIDSSSSRFLNSSAAFKHSLPSTLGTAESYLMSQNAEGGRAYRALVPTVSQQIDGKVSCFIFFVGHLLTSEQWI